MIFFSFLCLDVALPGRVFFCSDNWVPATCLPKGQSMDARNTRSRKAIETLSQVINEPTLKDLHAMLLSVIQRLDSIENDLLKRMTAVEESVENAHYRVSELEHQITSLQCQFKEMQTTRKDENIIQEYRSKEYNVLFHWLPQKGRIENHDQTEAVVRKFLTEELRVSPTQVDAIKFSNEKIYLQHPGKISLLHLLLQTLPWLILLT